MSWTLAGDTIPAPSGKSITRKPISITNRTLSGSFSRDYIGTEKKIIECSYDFIQASDIALIIAHYEDQRDNSTSKALVISTDSLSFSGNVLIDIAPVTFPAPNLYSWQRVKVTFTEV